MDAACGTFALCAVSNSVIGIYCCNIAFETDVKLGSIKNGPLIALSTNIANHVLAYVIKKLLSTLPPMIASNSILYNFFKPTVQMLYCLRRLKTKNRGCVQWFMWLKLCVRA